MPDWTKADQPPLSPRASFIVAIVDRGVARVAQHWSAITNLLGLCWLTLAAAPPVLRASGPRRAAGVAYAIHRPFYHQEADCGFHPLGKKMTRCERCFALYSGIALVGIAFVAMRVMRPLKVLGIFLLGLPLRVDITTHSTVWLESTTLFRVATGALLAIGTTWWLFPSLAVGLADLRPRRSPPDARLRPHDRFGIERNAPPLRSI